MLVTRFQSITTYISSRGKPEILLPNLTAAAILAIMSITTEISVAALVFSGPLAPFLPTGIGLFLVGTALGGLLVAVFSSYKAVMAGPRSGQAPIFVSLAAGVAIAMEGQSGEAVAVTAVVAILSASIFISIILFTIGWAKLGGMVRYIPYPVMGGFFAGLGYLLFKGGILVTLSSIASLDDPMSFLTMQSIVHLAPALLFAVLLYVLDQYVKHWLLMPCYLFATVVLFYAVLFITSTSVEMAAADFWLPAINATESSFFPVITFDQLSLVDWTAILAQSSTIMVMALMSIIMLLLDTSGVEIVIDRDMDPNHELKAAGYANVINGLCTGPIAIHTAADTAFSHKLGGNRFLMVLVFSLLVAAVLFVGPSPIAYVPTLMLGGLLMYIGIDFLMTWVWHTRNKLPLKDFAVVCGILLVVAVYGILEGVAVGIILAILLFVHSYSQLSVIKSSMSGAEHVSNVDRNQKQTRYLDQHGDELHIFVLQGFLFFGTASRLLEDIRKLLDDPKRSSIRYLVLDFNRVDAMDTSAANSFAKLLQVCRKGDVELVFTGCSQEIYDRLEGLIEGEKLSGKPLQVFNDLDEGVAWCGDKILESFDSDAEDNDPSQLLSQLLGNQNAASIISSSFEQVSIKGGETLFSQSDPGDALYLILQGSVSIVLDLPNGHKLHLRTMRTGAILGEMALYTGAVRSASALVNENSQFFKLDQESYKKMNDENPVEAGFFHTFIVRLMSERLGRANREILALSR